MIDPMTTTALMRQTYGLILLGWSVIGFLRRARLCYRQIASAPKD